MTSQVAKKTLASGTMDSSNGNAFFNKMFTEWMVKYHQERKTKGEMFKSLKEYISNTKKRAKQQQLQQQQ